MQRKITPFARKARQFVRLSKTVNRMIADGRFHQLKEEKKRSLVSKLRSLYRRLSQVFPARQLRGALAGAALLLGLGMGQQAQAQTFGPGVEAPFNFQNTATLNLPYFVDIDGDGDLDLLSSSYTYGVNDYTKLFLFENTGTSENPEFAAPVIEPFGIDDESFFNPVFVDIDGDGDYDLFMGQQGIGNILFRENTGTATNPVFGPTQQNPYGLLPLFYFPFISFADIDGDGDYDMIATEFYGNSKFFENTGTAMAPSFAAPVNNPFNIAPPPVAIIRTLAFGDVDGDGDLDLIYHDYNGDYYNTAMFYAENIGTPTAPQFAPGEPLTDIFFNGYYLAQPAFADIDADGDLDLFVGTFYFYGGLVFFENQLIVNALPVTQDASVMTIKNVPYTFSAGDFPFDDANMDDMLEGIRITGLTSVGSLTLAGVDVVQDQEITAAEIGQLVFTPNPGEFGLNYDSFAFQVFDGEDYSPTSATMTIDVEDNVSATENALRVRAYASPNPAADELRLSMEFQSAPGQLTISIANVYGQVLQVASLEAMQTSLQTNLDVSGLAPGLHFVRLQAGERVHTIRFVKR
jgi:hypothetical protein